jgi:HEPN domain-containing protein
MSLHTDQAQELQCAAERDRKTFRILLQSCDAPIETTLFHAQQAIEKAIKAALVERGIVFRRTHDLVELAELAARQGIDLPVPMDLLMRLGPYAVEFRYLGVQALAVPLNEADAALEAMFNWLG